MNKKNFWSIFHGSWGYSTNNMRDYNKEAWRYVQHQVERFIENQEQKDKENKKIKL